LCASTAITCKAAVIRPEGETLSRAPLVYKCDYCRKVWSVLGEWEKCMQTHEEGRWESDGGS
jgi:hypothetical protein